MKQHKRVAYSSEVLGLAGGRSIIAFHNKDMWEFQAPWRTCTHTRTHTKVFCSP